MDPRNSTSGLVKPSRQGISEILGPPEARYFGGGFRRVSHRIEHSTDTGSATRIMLNAVGSAFYPDDWSLDASGKPRSVHLSTFDALALTASTLRHAASGNEWMIRLLNDFAVRSVRVKAPARTVTSIRGIDITVQGTELEDEAGGWHVISRVGGFTVDLDLSPENWGFLPIDEQLHQPHRSDPFTEGWMTPLAPTAIRTVQELEGSSITLTCLEEMAMFGQLSQLVVYTAKDTDRHGIPNLWLRQLSLVRSARTPSARIEARTTLTRDRILRVNGDTLVDIQVSFETDYGAVAKASFGYRPI